MKNLLLFLFIPMSIFVSILGIKTSLEGLEEALRPVCFHETDQKNILSNWWHNNNFKSIVLLSKWGAPPSPLFKDRE